MFLGRAALFSVAVALPILLWRFTVSARTGTFYWLEGVEYGQVVWIGQALHQGVSVLLGSLISNVLTIVGRDTPYFLFLLLYSTSISVATGWPQDLRRTLRQAVGVDMLVVALSFVAFFSLVGLTEERVAFSVVPPMVLAAAVAQGRSLAEVPRSNLVIPRIAALVLASLFFAYELLKTGPFG